MQANSRHHKLFHFHFAFSIWETSKRSEKSTKIGIPPERKEPFRWNKSIFIVFGGLSIGL